MRTRLVGGAALGLATALVLSSCGSSAPSTEGGDQAADGGQVTLKMVAADYGDGPGKPNSGETFWKGVVDEFQAANPNIKVDVQVINWNDIDTQVATMVQNGQVPDILQTGDYSGFVGDQLLYKVDEVLSPATSADMLEKFAEFGKVDGTAYGIPFVSSARALFYNKELFAKAKITDPPKTWDELKAAAEKLKAAGVSQPFGLPLGQEEAQAESFLWMLGNGGGYKDDSGNWAINSPQNVETFGYLKGLRRRRPDHPEPGHQGPQDGLGGLRRGQGRHGQRWTDVHPDLRRGRPEGLRRRAHRRQGGPARHHPRRHGLDHGVQQERPRREIKKFFDFFYTCTAAQKISDTYKLLPVTKGGIDKLSGDEKLKPFLDGLPNASFYPFQDPKWAEVNPQIKQIIGGAVKDDPAKVLGELQKTAEAS